MHVPEQWTDGEGHSATVKDGRLVISAKSWTRNISRGTMVVGIDLPPTRGAVSAEVQHVESDNLEP